MGEFMTVMAGGLREVSQVVPQELGYGWWQVQLSFFFLGGL